MIAVLHQVLFMTYVSTGGGVTPEAENTLDMYRLTNFEFQGKNHVLEEGIVVFDFSEVQE